MNSAEGLRFLDDHLSGKSYISSYEPTQNDVAVFRTLRNEPEDEFVNAQRWYRHLKSFGNDRKEFPEAAEVIKLEMAADHEVSLSAAPLLIYICFLTACIYSGQYDRHNCPFVYRALSFIDFIHH